MTRQEWLDLKPNAFFKNKEFFPNLTEEDLNEVLFDHELNYGEEHFIKNEYFLKNYCSLVEVAGNLRSFLNEPMIIKSGFRSIRKHKDIYINQLKRKESQIPWGSLHLKLQAFDFRTKSTHTTMEKIKSFYNKDGSVKDIKFYPDDVWEKVWFEDFEYTRRENERNSWIHCQIFPPKSKSRFFKP